MYHSEATCGAPVHYEATCDALIACEFWQFTTKMIDAAGGTETAVIIHEVFGVAFSKLIFPASVKANTVIYKVNCIIIK